VALPPRTLTSRGTRRDEPPPDDRGMDRAASWRRTEVVDKTPKVPANFCHGCGHPSEERPNGAHYRGCKLIGQPWPML
jgi:hypothetical protein